MPVAIVREVYRLPRCMRLAPVAYALAGLVLWPTPLFNVLHAESAAVIAAVAFFAAGLTSLGAFRDDLSLPRVLAWQEAALVVPLLMATVPVLWAPNCAYLTGLFFFALFPGVTVVLAVALAFFLDSVRLPRRGLVLVMLGAAIVVLGPLYDLGLHPQFYTYNHVFGGVLGPIYDTELAVRPGLFWFRGLTLLWAALAVLVGLLLRRRGSGSVWRAESRGWAIDDDGSILPPQAIKTWYGLAVATAVIIVLVYAFAAPLGINTPAWYIEQQLGSHLQTEHFDIYFDAGSMTPEEQRRLTIDHEYRYRWLEDRLEVEPDERVASYVYPSPDVKARLTGARYTSVAPVWLARPQVHVLLDRYERSFGHELVHVFSRSFGLPVINASRSVGLVEGLAVALEPPQGRPTVHEQVSAAAVDGVEKKDFVDLPLAEDVAARLSPFGFWTGRGAVSYTTMGSFVTYLIDTYGPDRFKEAYAWAGFESVYGRPVLALAREWEVALSELDLVARDAAPFARERFSRPSLFEVRCPHYVPPYRRAYRAGDEALAAGDTTEAVRHLADALDRWPAYPAALATWADVMLARGESRNVVARLDTAEVAREVPAVSVRLGDAYALVGPADSARALYRRARLQLPTFAFNPRARLVVREAVADRPAVIDVLVSGDSARHQARRLEALRDSGAAVDVVRGLALLEAGAYRDAVPLLHGRLAALADSLGASEGTLLHLQRLVWLGELAFRAGAVAKAEAYARAAAAAFDEAGARNQSERMGDVAAKMRWIQEEHQIDRWIGWRGDPFGTDLYIYDAPGRRLAASPLTHPPLYVVSYTPDHIRLSGRVDGHGLPQFRECF